METTPVLSPREERRRKYSCNDIDELLRRADVPTTLDYTAVKLAQEAILDEARKPQKEIVYERSGTCDAIVGLGLLMIIATLIFTLLTDNFPNLVMALAIIGVLVLLVGGIGWKKKCTYLRAAPDDLAWEFILYGPYARRNPVPAYIKTLVQELENIPNKRFLIHILPGYHHFLVIEYSPRGLPPVGRYLAEW